jgi:hypothetical protein
VFYIRFSASLNNQITNGELMDNEVSPELRELALSEMYKEEVKKIVADARGLLRRSKHYVTRGMDGGLTEDINDWLDKTERLGF